MSTATIRELKHDTTTVLSCAPPPAEVTMEAERLSALHSEKRGTRSLDISHGACVLVLRLPRFLVFDRQQAAPAKAAGLKVPIR